ncbi:MAG: biotin transporter BioY [Clostridiales bacterium]|nr:biotin transporter BioY [Clostridiales bacterium]
MSTRRLVYIAIFTALITVGGLISVPIPFTQVQLSFQTVFVIAAGLVLGGRDGALAVLVYIAMGLFGLPVFTAGGGPQYVFMPSFGYLIGFPIGAFVSGTLCKRIKSTRRGKVFLCALVGCIPIYVVGVTYQVLILYYYLNNAWAAVIAGVPAVGVLLVKDAVMCGLCSILYPSLMRAMRYKKSSCSRK